MATLDTIKKFFDRLITDPALRNEVLSNPKVLYTKLKLGSTYGDNSELADAQQKRVKILIEGTNTVRPMLRQRVDELNRILEAWSAASAAVVYADGCQTPYKGGYTNDPTMPVMKLDWTSPDEVIRALELAATQPDSRPEQKSFLLKAAKQHPAGSQEEHSLNLIANNLE